MIEWTEKTDKYGITELLGKINGIQICRAECRPSSGQAYFPPEGDFYAIRIRTKWNTKEGHVADYHTKQLILDGVVVGKNTAPIKAYCERRWKEWYTKLGLTRA